jgi:hypothetical protein
MHLKGKVGREVFLYIHMRERGRKRLRRWTVVMALKLPRPIEDNIDSLC